MKKTLIWVMVAILVVIAIIYIYKIGVSPDGKTGESTNEGIIPPQERSLAGEVEDVQLPDFDTEFQSIDQDLNQL